MSVEGWKVEAGEGQRRLSCAFEERMGTRRSRWCYSKTTHCCFWVGNAQHHTTFQVKYQTPQYFLSQIEKGHLFRCLFIMSSFFRICISFPWAQLLQTNLEHQNPQLLFSISASTSDTSRIILSLIFIILCNSHILCPSLKPLDMIFFEISFKFAHWLWILCWIGYIHKVLQVKSSRTLEL